MVNDDSVGCSVCPGQDLFAKSITRHLGSSSLKQQHEWSRDSATEIHRPLQALAFAR